MLDVLVSTVSSIEWTDATWNPVRGCSKVSAGCTNCYAMKQAHRFSGPGKPYEGLTHLVKGKGPQWTGAVRTVPDVLEDPLRWRAPRRVFVNSMSDLFHEDVPFEFVDDVFGIMALCQQHTFQILTKRPERMADYLTLPDLLETRAESVARAAEHFGKVTFDSRGSDRGNYRTVPGPRMTDEQLARRRRWPGWPLPNVWLGTSVEDQSAADERIPHLLRTPAAVRFLSCEPLLGPVRIGPLWRMCESWPAGYCSPEEARAAGAPVTLHPQALGNPAWRLIHWVIAGGESGPGARPCNVAWIRRLVGECLLANVPVFVKQLGARPYQTGQAYAASLTSMVECEHGYDVCPTCDADDVPLKLVDRKGGDPSEWPEDLRVREFPT